MFSAACDGFPSIFMFSFASTIDNRSNNFPTQLSRTDIFTIIPFKVLRLDYEKKLRLQNTIFMYL